MTALHRINEIMNKEKSQFRRRQMMKILQGLEMEWERKQRTEE